jgi:hypothetical protein
MKRMIRQILFILKYAVGFAILFGFLIFIFANLFSSVVPGALSSSSNGTTEILSFSNDPSDIGRSRGGNLPFVWIAIYVGFLLGWAIGWHRLKEKKSKIVWRVYRDKSTRKK